MAETPSRYQLKDMEVRSADPYAAAKYEILLEWLKDRPRMSILNAGCGSGEFSHLLARAGHRVTGIDLDETYVKMARESARSQGLDGCEFKAVAIESFESAERFDAVVATDVIEHISDDDAAMKKLLSLVKPEGLVLVTVPAEQWLFGHHDEMLGHYRRYGRVSLCNLLNRHLKLERVRAFGFFLIPLCLWYSRILRRAYPIAALGTRKAPLRSLLLDTLLRLEKAVPFPFGTSLLAMGRARPEESRP